VEYKSAYSLILRDNPINKKTFMKNKEDLSTNINVLSEAVRVNGNLTSSKNIRIVGTVEGDVHVDGVLILDKKGVINGNAFASRIEISGNITGSLKSAGKITVRETAIVIGDIESKALEVEEHAIVEGEIRMSEQENVTGKEEKKNTEKSKEPSLTY